jgi:hypothetical protein
MSQTSGVFPLGTSYFPGEKVVLRVFEDRYLNLMQDIKMTHNSFVSVLIEQGSEVGGGDKRFSYGVHVKVENIYEADIGVVVEAQATERVKIVSWLGEYPYPMCEFVAIRDEVPTQQHIHEAASAISLLAQRIRTLHVMIEDAASRSHNGLANEPQLTTIAGGRWWAAGVSIEEVNRAFWVIASLVPCGPLDRYELLLPETILKRISILRNTIEHVTELIAFQQRN